jgi:hypothetical protein
MGVFWKLRLIIFWSGRSNVIFSLNYFKLESGRMNFLHNNLSPQKMWSVDSILYRTFTLNNFRKGFYATKWEEVDTSLKFSSSITDQSVARPLEYLTSQNVTLSSSTRFLLHYCFDYMFNMSLNDSEWITIKLLLLLPLPPPLSLLLPPLLLPLLQHYHYYQHRHHYRY